MAAINNVDAVAAVVAVLLGVAILLGSMRGFRYVFTYDLENSWLNIRICGVTVRRVAVSDIDRIEVIPFAALLPFSKSFRWDAFLSWKWCGYNKNVVAMKKRTGLMRGIIVSPRDPEAFANALRGGRDSLNERRRL